ncbi:MAG: D-alanyl-D-alanine carboxypeptidase/D-alanyl-D-alanine endopeptidase [Candidatus Eremiobacter antarcticus]|nr:D-alanyl-D-alanine carboxypeptidase/D-alanyl-D-alanine-endopeptidase [Candidatus Eremiobacteraeota bacterium]MBC5807846.1 D-alanyl-D-alanine carboxypeptidase/D-alanyl-D-alanine-endopeptidase [Candidatus Eremiobacteraeota bacterium]
MRTYSYRAVERLPRTRGVRRGGRRRRRSALRVALVLLVVAGIAAAVAFALRPHALPRQSKSIVAPVPGPVSLPARARWTPNDVAGLQAHVREVIDGQAFPPSTTGVTVADARTGKQLYSRNARVALVPGSTVKLIVAAAALDALGSGYRFKTSIVTNGELRDGTLQGNIWLVGGGDPVLTSDDLRRAVHELQLAGVERIHGNVYADGSRFGNDEINATWLPEDLPYGWAAPASAISIDGGSEQFTLTPSAGTTAKVSIDPPGARVLGSVATGSSYSDNTLRIDALPDGSGYRLSGQIPYGASQKYWRSVPHPTRSAAIALFQMLRLAGLSVEGFPFVGTTPAGRVLWEHRSAPLDRIVNQMFVTSDNHIAEQLLRAVGWKATGVGSMHRSLAALNTFLRRKGIPRAGVVLADGSGLSDHNRVTAQCLLGVLRFMARHKGRQAATLLPRVGMEGTVSVRHLSPEALGRVYAKDGYIAGASSLAGYVFTAHHGLVSFAFLVDDWQHGLDGVWAGEDQILSRIARF